jgi:HK97 gp10 family phage protein
LRRSIKVLTHMSDKRSKYVGVEIQPRGSGKGTFSGTNTDGWYARFVEFGPRKKPFMRPAVVEAGPAAVGIMRKFVAKRISQISGRN